MCEIKSRSTDHWRYMGFSTKVLRSIHRSWGTARSPCKAARPHRDMQWADDIIYQLFLFSDHGSALGTLPGHHGSRQIKRSRNLDENEVIKGLGLTRNKFVLRSNWYDALNRNDTAEVTAITPIFKIVYADATGGVDERMDPKLAWSGNLLSTVQLPFSWLGVSSYTNWNLLIIIQ